MIKFLNNCLFLINYFKFNLLQKKITLIFYLHNNKIKFFSLFIILPIRSIHKKFNIFIILNSNKTINKIIFLLLKLA